MALRFLTPDGAVLPGSTGSASPSDADTSDSEPYKTSSYAERCAACGRGAPSSSELSAPSTSMAAAAAAFFFLLRA